ncbi:hypothetical protein BCV69DRAFT_188927 [Microstroma glucosiphilum]|uniref:Uncharacterized protein n=1 Tax=Pseudomicrostroma glucosiphilum TaxID=1684307 RepID=A0A316U7E8_9BASI|nr:hypothetical protein BCV69DRAFT_188927 [Pseudomicrostroma glucosiphilum]PWN21160.1 hypothetical protein BCV69DRAFT_188927 [Pseudomicrostroma glucosiphilum]
MSSPGSLPELSPPPSPFPISAESPPSMPSPSLEGTMAELLRIRARLAAYARSRSEEAATSTLPPPQRSHRSVSGPIATTQSQETSIPSSPLSRLEQGLEVARPEEQAQDAHGARREGEAREVPRRAAAGTGSRRPRNQGPEDEEADYHHPGYQGADVRAGGPRGGRGRQQGRGEPRTARRGRRSAGETNGARPNRGQPSLADAQFAFYRRRMRRRWG